MTLDEQLRALKEAEGHVEVPRHLEARLMEAFQKLEVRSQKSEVWEGSDVWDRKSEKLEVKDPRYGWRLWQNWPVMTALAAGLIGGATITLVQVGRDPEAPTLAAVPVSESVVLVLEPPGVQETVRVVRIRVARSALASLGIQTVAAQGSDSVEIDVLVGEDGVARGVRLAM